MLDVDKYSAAQVSSAVDKETSGLKAKVDELLGPQVQTAGPVQAPNPGRKLRPRSRRPNS